MSGSAQPAIKKLYIRFTTYERPAKQPKLFSTLYFSFRFQGLEYFSSEMPLADPDGRLIFQINDHFMYVLDSEVSPTEPIEVTRWENHLSIFTFPIEIGEITGKPFLRRRLQTKPYDFINISLSVLEDKELLLLDRKTNQIAHYFVVDRLEFQPVNEQSFKVFESPAGPSFLSVMVGKKKYMLPDGVHNRCLVLQLPTKMMFEYYREGQLQCKSEVLDSGEYLRKITKLGLASVESNSRAAFVELEGRWGYNFSNTTESSLLLDVMQLNLYNFEITFDKENQYPETKMKVTCGNKLYELIPDGYNGKNMRFKKLLHLFMKAEDEQIVFRLEKNHIEYCNLRIFTDELHGFQTVKRKLNDSNTSKQVGIFRFRCQKGKTVGGPENNSLWREYSKKKINYNYLLALEQLSYYLEDPATRTSKLKFHVNMGTSNLPIDDIICLSNYAPGILPAHQRQKLSLLNVREQNSVCLVFEPENKPTDEPKDDLEGIGVIDLNQVRLGLNSLVIPVYKDQQIVSYVNLLVNKVPNLTICKNEFQPEILGRLKKKTRNVSVEMGLVTMNGFFYTFEYENKSQLYCIVEINRIKKVLLLERKGNTLEFLQGQGSDYLNFVVEEMEYMRVKLTFLIADLGFEEEIYGSVSFKCRFIDLMNSGNISFARTNIKNSSEVVVGNVSAKLNMGDLNRKSVEHQLRIEKEVDRASKKPRAAEIQSDRNLSMDNGSNRYASIDVKEPKSEKYSHKDLSVSVSKERRNNSQSVKLPALPKRVVGRKSNTNLKSVSEIVKEVNKKKSNALPPAEVKEAPKNEEEDGMDLTIQKLEKEVQKNRRIFAMNRLPHRKNKLAEESLKSIEKNDISDPSVQHNFDILFPRKFSKMKRGELQQQINQYEQQLKGLKSILTSIDGDIHQVEPELHSRHQPPPPDINAMQFQDNEFMVADMNPK